MQSNHTYTFRTKHEIISAKLIAKQWGDNPTHGDPALGIR